MILPVGRDQTGLRRPPVVTLLCIVACLVAYGIVPGPRAEQRAATEEALREVVESYIEEPDLHLNPHAAEAFAVFLREAEPLARHDIDKRMAAYNPRTDVAFADRQAKLDAKVQHWEQLVRLAPQWRFGLVPAAVEPLRLLTAPLVPNSLWHLLFSLWFLYFAAAFLEDNWGRPVYALFVIGAGAASGLGFVLQHRALDAPLVGLSGIVAAHMGAAMVRFGRSSMQLLNLVPSWRFSVPAWLLFLVWFGVEAFGVGRPGFAVVGALHVSYWAQVWGFAFGVVVAILIWQLRIEERFVREAIARREEIKGDPFMSQLQRLLGAGKREEAARLLAERIRREPTNVDIADTYWHLVHTGRAPNPPAAIALRIIHNDLVRKDELTAVERWRELTEQIPDVAPELYMAEALARALIRFIDRPAAWAMLDRGWKSVDPTTPAANIVGWARLVYATGNPIAQSALERALADPRVKESDKRILSDALESLQRGKP